MSVEPGDAPDPGARATPRRGAGRPEEGRDPSVDSFRSAASEMWGRIPTRFRAGVEALVVEEEAVRHPELPGIFTLGECVSDHWPSAYSEEGGDVRSRVVLYYGSFRELAARDPAFDWHGEIWETLLHELLHHREFAAAEEGLEAYDAALDQNFRRHAGLDFDPDFYRWVPADASGAVRIESETFVESTVPAGSRQVTFRWRERGFDLRVPGTDQVLFVNPRNLTAGRLWVVVRRRESWWRRLMAMADDQAPEVRHLQRRALPVAAA